ncbi:MAG: helix-turn-helix transcriptional regulator [Polyangiaceae bacterium]
MSDDGSSVNRQIGQRIRLARVGKGWSMGTLGELLGVSYQQVQKYELGRNTVSPAKLLALSEVFGVPVAYFFDEPAKADDEVDGSDAKLLLRLMQRLRIVARRHPSAYRHICELAAALCRDERE